MIAYRVHDVQVVESPYHGKVTFHGKAGIKVEGLTASDSGLYSIKLEGVGYSTGHVVLNRNVTLEVVEGMDILFDLYNIFGQKSGSDTLPFTNFKLFKLELLIYANDDL